MSDDNQDGTAVPSAADAATADGTGDAPAPQPLSRRAVLRVLGTVPIAGALGARIAWPQQASTPQPPPRQTHESPSPPAQRTPTPPASRPLPHFFSRAEQRLAGVLADDILPADDRSPSATAVGAVEFIDFHLSVPETTDDTRTAVRGGLHWLDTESRRRYGRGYASASTAQRHALLDDVAWPARVRPEMSQGAAFFARFRDLVAAGYFSSAAGWADLRYRGNVFNPGWSGCPDAALKKLGVTYAVMETRVPPQ